MHEIDYESPTSLADAVAILQKTRESVRCLAGGTDLIDHLRTGRIDARQIVDVKKLPELQILEAGPEGLRLGAAVCCRNVCAHAAIQKDYTALADSGAIIGGIQIQNRASLGGNLCNSGPAADSIPSMIALSGICVIAGPDGLREVPVEKFCVGPGKNVLKPGELLVEIRFPKPAAHSGSHYRRFIPRNEMDIAVVGVAAAVTLSADGSQFVAGRIALGAVGPTPLLAEEASTKLIGQPVNDDTIAAAAAAARELAAPISDMRGTADYRKHLTEVLTRRVLSAAVTRARGEKVDHRPGW